MVSLVGPLVYGHPYLIYKRAHLLGLIRSSNFKRRGTLHRHLNGVRLSLPVPLFSSAPLERCRWRHCSLSLGAIDVGVVPIPYLYSDITSMSKDKFHVLCNTYLALRVVSSPIRITGLASLNAFYRSFSCLGPFPLNLVTCVDALSGDVHVLAGHNRSIQGAKVGRQDRIETDNGA